MADFKYAAIVARRARGVDSVPPQPLARSMGIARLDMRCTCTHAGHMTKMIQIRNVPDAIHRKLKVRAASQGRSLSDYLLEELARIASLPTREEFLARLHSRAPVTLRTPAAEIIREGRESA